MYRSCLTLLCIFLFSQFAANAQLTQRIVLTGVSVDTVSPQQIQLTWEYLGIDTVFTIYRCKSNCNEDGAPWSMTDTAMVRMDQNDLIWRDTLANVNANNYYAVGWGRSGKSAPQNNMVLKAINSKDCDNAVSLSWTSWVKYVNNDKDFDWDPRYIYNNERDTLDYYIYYRIKDSTGFELVEVRKGIHDTIIYPATEMRCEIKLADNELYEFVIQAISKSDGNSVFSNIVESRIKNEYIPVKTSITCVNLVDDQYLEIGVEIDSFSSSFDKLYLFRAYGNPLPPFTVIDSIDYDATTNIYSFKDEDVNPNLRLYYYKVLPYTECYSNDTSNVVTNIWLWGERVFGEKYRDRIAFYRRGIYNESYKLVYMMYGNERVIIDTVFTDTYYYIDVLGYTESGIMTYKVISETGCVSNTVTIPHEPVLRFPTAFNPGDLNFENTTFHPIFQFLPDTENYLFVIYNRWGQELFRTDLLPNCANYTKCRWDGTFQGKECPPGIYAFRISYTYNDGAGRYSNSGSFMLVR